MKVIEKFSSEKFEPRTGSNAPAEDRIADRERRDREDYGFFRTHPTRRYHARPSDPGESRGAALVLLAFIGGSRTVQRIIAGADDALWLAAAWETVLTRGDMPERWCKQAFNRALGLMGEPRVGRLSAVSGPMLTPGQRLERRAERWARLSSADPLASAA